MGIRSGLGRQSIVPVQHYTLPEGAGNILLAPRHDGLTYDANYRTTPRIQQLKIGLRNAPPRTLLALIGETHGMGRRFRNPRYLDTELSVAAGEILSERTAVETLPKAQHKALLRTIEYMNFAALSAGQTAQEAESGYKKMQDNLVNNLITTLGQQNFSAKNLLSLRDLATILAGNQSPQQKAQGHALFQKVDYELENRVRELNQEILVHYAYGSANDGRESAAAPSNTLQVAAAGELARKVLKPTAAVSDSVLARLVNHPNPQLSAAATQRLHKRFDARHKRVSDTAVNHLARGASDSSLNAKAMATLAKRIGKGRYSDRTVYEMSRNWSNNSSAFESAIMRLNRLMDAGTLNATVWRDIVQQHDNDAFKQQATEKLESHLILQARGKLSHHQSSFQYIILSQLINEPPSERIAALLSSFFED